MPRLAGPALVLFVALAAGPPACDDRGRGGGAGAGAFAPEPCDAMLLLTGGEGGVVEVVGDGPGGLVRRAALFDAARPRAGAASAIAIGAALGPGDARQNELKADLLRASQAALGYAGQLLSPEDLSPDALALSQPMESPEGTPRPPLNVRVKPAGPLGVVARADPVLRFRLGDVPVRAVSLADPTTQGVLAETWGVADIVIAPDVALSALVREPGLLLVAAHVMREDLAVVAAAAARLADAVVVVDVMGQVAAPAPVRDRSFDRPLLVAFAPNGREVGVLRLRRLEGAWRASFDAVALDARFDGRSSPARDAVAGLLAAYRRRVREAGLLAARPARPDGSASYAGATSCRPCHEAVFESWRATPHARALAALEPAGASWDPECVRCHATGWAASGAEEGRPASAFATPEATPGLGGVQCEDCHGPGSAHVVARDGKAAFRPGGTMVAVPPRAVCARCHDAVHSAGFTAAGAYKERYLPAVDHRDVPKERRTNPK